MSLFPQGHSIRELAHGSLNHAPEATDDKDLVALRVAIGRIAQTLGVQTDSLPVINASYQDLNDMAAGNERGWHTLAGTCVDRALALRAATSWNADESRNHEFDPPGTPSA